MLDKQAIRLLLLVKTICHYESELESQSGERFNLLQILKVGHLEVKTHSPILAELLDPLGSHGQGCCFLKLFVDQLGGSEKGVEEEISTECFIVEGAEVKMEHHIGRVTETEGGRIDILIRDSAKKHILIENKIYAGEQENQILRYQQYDQKAHIIFLTLDGRSPTSAGEMPIEKIQCISYEKDIIEWLEACRKEVATVPIVRESLTQYINLIKILTNQNTSSRMSQTITEEILKSKECFQAYYALRNSETELQVRIKNRIDSKLIELAKDKSVDLEYCSAKEAKGAPIFDFKCKAWDDEGFCIRFEFDTRNYRDFSFGIYDTGEMGPEGRRTIKEKFEGTYKSVNGGGKYPEWPTWIYWDAYRHWDAETLEGIYFDTEIFIADFKRELVKLKEICDDFVKGRCPS